MFKDSFKILNKIMFFMRRDDLVLTIVQCCGVESLMNIFQHHFVDGECSFL